MRVLHLLASNKYSGAENVACQIIKMFDGEVDMAYCSPAGEISKALQERGIEYLPIKKLTVKEVKKIITKYDPDILHCHDLKASIIGSRFKKIKIISHIHGNKSNMSKVSLQSILFKIASKRFSKILWVSKSCLDDYIFKSKVIEKSLVLENIISVENLYKKASEDKNTYENFDLVFLGRLVYEKNPLRLVEIAKLLKKYKEDFSFAIVGDGIYRNEVEQKIKEYGLEKNITCFGFIPNPFKILMSSKIMLMTSIMEGTPMCALESISCGVPVISTKTDGMNELIKNHLNGYLYNENEEAVRVILNLLNNDASLNELKSKTKKFAMEYNDCKKYTKSLRGIYN